MESGEWRVESGEADGMYGHVSDGTMVLDVLAEDVMAIMLVLLT